MGTCTFVVCPVVAHGTHNHISPRASFENGLIQKNKLRHHGTFPAKIVFIVWRLLQEHTFVRFWARWRWNCFWRLAEIFCFFVFQADFAFRCCILVLHQKLLSLPFPIFPCVIFSNSSLLGVEVIIFASPGFLLLVAIFFSSWRVPDSYLLC